MDEIFFQKLGEGRPVILIHGFCESHEIWDGFAEQLAKKFCVFTIDLPGFGKSPLPLTQFSIDDIATKVLGWIDREKIDRPVVIGHSLGGYVALAMGNRSSNKLAGLGLFHSTPYPDSEERKINRNRVIEFVKKNGVNPFVDTFVPGLFFDRKNQSIPKVDEIARKTSLETLVSYTAAMRDRPSAIHTLQKFERPVLVLGGEKDSIITMESIMEFVSLIPDCTLHILKDVGHMAMFESPQEAKNIVSDFILRIQ